MFDRDPLDRAHHHARRYLERVASRPVATSVDVATLRAALGGPLPDTGEAAARVVDLLATAADPGIVASAGPRYFGFVTGGALPAALGADWLAAAWDQNATFAAMSPSAAICEEIGGGWLLDVLGLPATASVGFTTGAQQANVVGLLAARNAQLARAGHDVAALGLRGSPELRLIVGEEAHATVFAALRQIGLGDATAERVPCDPNGAMDPAALAATLAAAPGTPTIVCAQAGNVNTGAIDPLDPIADACIAHGAWLHVDGAFGLWARASRTLAPLGTGAERADSWATDGHKWLNVPYDCGVAIVADERAHRAATGLSAAYLPPGELRDNGQYVPEASRRARGFAVWAALRQLGRDGVEAIIDRCCEIARAMADRLDDEARIEILNDVCLNQILVRLDDDDDATNALIAAVQADGTCWCGGTVWRGRAAMRISVSSWATTQRDGELSAQAIVRCARDVGRRSGAT